MMQKLLSSWKPVTIGNVERSVPINSGHGTTDVIWLTHAVSEAVDDQFEGGTLTITSINKVVTVNASRTSTGGATKLYVPAGSFTEADVVAARGQEGRLTDDDDLTASPRLPDGGALLQSAFGNAYIRPLYLDQHLPGVDSPNDTVQFQAHLRDDLDAIDDARNAQSEADFWSTLVVGCFENTPETDGDPDGNAPGSNLNYLLVGRDQSMDWGYSGAVSAVLSDQNRSAIFLETIRDVGPASSMPEAAVVTHEIGHTWSTESNPHKSEGLMREVEFGSSETFDNDSLAKFRSTNVW